MDWAECRAAARLFRETGDKHGEGAALANVGLALLSTRQFEEAISACQDAVAAFRQTGDLHLPANARAILGDVLVAMRLPEEAVRVFEDAAAGFGVVIPLESARACGRSQDPTTVRGVTRPGYRA